MPNNVIQPIRRLLIANRGEIARRIIRTAHDLGIGTVAVYADGDVGAPFVTEADTAIALNGLTSAQTYLDVDKVLAACARTGADAVHPGYGFLSENTAFADAVVKAGIRWVGPSSAAIAAMGDKLSAKRIMRDADVPTLPAIELKPGEDIEAAAREIGYPVLVKASAGGGGRGMRVVEGPGQLDEAVVGARREAGAAFGDDTLFLERWVTSSRHVEIQILGDNFGNLVHLFERECSIQRRHQKIIEEAPSPAVGEELRMKMGEAAVSAARQIGYSSAGTVEFLLDGEQFWFLEVNTRLQVEHPVTEEIVLVSRTSMGQRLHDRIDLVREQLRIAEGEELGYAQDDLAIHGHAIEARLYAEDPDRDFLPAPGTVVEWSPAAGDVRYDAGVESGSDVSQHFDPMIAKVIAHAPTRREAASKLARALEQTRLQGLANNRDFLVATLRHPAFIAGDTTTDFIERINPERKRQLAGADLADAVTAAAMYAQRNRRVRARTLNGFPSGWRNSRMPPERIRYKLGDAEIAVEYRSRRNGSFAMRIGEEERNVAVFGAEHGGVDLEVDGRRIQLSVSARGDRWLVHGPAGDAELEELPRLPVPGALDSKGGLTAPMPGNVLATHVDVGEHVRAGQLLLVLEAMKMQHRITAPFDGAVTELHVAEGDQVDNGALLVMLEDQDSAGD